MDRRADKPSHRDAIAASKNALKCRIVVWTNSLYKVSNAYACIGLNETAFYPYIIPFPLFEMSYSLSGSREANEKMDTKRRRDQNFCPDQLYDGFDEQILFIILEF